VYISWGVPLIRFLGFSGYKVSAIAWSILDADYRLLKAPIVRVRRLISRKNLSNGLVVPTLGHIPSGIEKEESVRSMFLMKFLAAAGYALAHFFGTGRFSLSPAASHLPGLRFTVTPLAYDSSSIPHTIRYMTEKPANGQSPAPRDIMFRGGEMNVVKTALLAIAAAFPVFCAGSATPGENAVQAITLEVIGAVEISASVVESGLPAGDVVPSGDACHNGCVIRPAISVSSGFRAKITVASDPVARTEIAIERLDAPTSGETLRLTLTEP
jgi:hypothetical protein